MADIEKKLTRIGVFYDGNFFAHVSNYYRYAHERRARIGISGLHHFIRHEVARAEETDARYCQIVDAHYFRGRLSAKDAENRNQLFNDRVFDDVLMREGVTTHFLPLSSRGEKGIDVWFALEAFELATYKRFNVVVLIACDGDYIPLVRKLNTLGTRVMLLAWDFNYIDGNGSERQTRTSQGLIEEVSHPLMMADIIDDRSRRTDPLVNNLFTEPRHDKPAPAAANARPRGGQDDTAPEETPGARFSGKVKVVKEGWGFIVPDDGGNDMFFYYTDVQDVDFNELRPGDWVEYTLGSNDKGPAAKEVRPLEPAAGE